MYSVLMRRLWVAGFLVLAGCTPKSDNPATVPVTGVVTLDGQPVEGANVMFQSPEQGSFGLTDAQGRYELQTFEPGDGAMPGEYRVAISKVKVFLPKVEQGEPGYVEPPPPEHLVPSKYAAPTSSGLTATVTEGKDNEFNFELKK